MALDPGTAAVFGAAVAVFGTLGATIADRLGRRRERTEDAARDDHVRNIDRRRELYVDCLAAVTNIGRAADQLGLEKEHPDKVIDGAARAYRAWDEASRFAASLELDAPASVRREFNELVTIAYGLAEGDDPEELRARIPDAHRKLVDAMRTDLRVLEPDDERPSWFARVFRLPAR